MSEANFGLWLKREIENRMMSQAKFAELSGLSRAILHKWINHGQRPRGSSVVRVAKTLGVPRDLVEAQIPQT